MQGRRLYIIAVALFVVASLPGTAVTDEGGTIDSTWYDILTRELYQPCRDFEYNARQLIPAWRTQRKFDFIEKALDFIEKSCDESEEYGYVLKARILTSMQAGTFSEDLYDGDVYTNMIESDRFRFVYWSRRGSLVIDGSAQGDLSTIDFSKIMGLMEDDDVLEVADRWYGFDLDMRSLADSLLPLTKSGSPERLWCYIYTYDTTALKEELLNKKAARTKIGRSALNYYNDVKVDAEDNQRRIDSLKSDMAFTAAAAIGNWAPTGDLKAVGTRRYLDFTLTGYFKRTFVELDLGFAWQDADNFLQVRHENRSDSTNSFSTVQFTVNTGYRLLDLGPLTTYGVGGLGVASVTLIESDNNQYNDKKITESFMMTFGIRQLIGAKRHRGLFGQIDLRYNFMWLGNDGGTDLGGNVATITAGLGYHFW